ncbi:MAG TPA: hypothetical protein EYN91_19200 [Candidatus Melainabacteria bacterium]|nr:hypothetical protein [Candidatus Melainabacteria bacterium]
MPENSSAVHVLPVSDLGFLDVETNNFPKGKYMKLRRAIAALGTAFALSFSLMLAPSLAHAATVTINPRPNAVEAGQILAAPDGSVFTISVYDAGLAHGQKSVTHTYQTGNTLRQTANKIVQAINADTDLQAIGVTATLGTGANYTINSTSTNGTLYKQTTTGGGTNHLAIQQTLTISGTVTVDDKLTLTIYDAGLVGGKEAVVYKPNTGDTLADIVIRLRNKINNSTTLAPLGITAKVNPTDSSVLLIESPTFDATEKFTSYSANVKAGGTETMTLGSFWGTNGAQTIAVNGPVMAGEKTEFVLFNPDLPDYQKTINYIAQTGDGINKVACGLRTEINNDSDLAEIGVHATCGGGGGVLTVTSTSSNLAEFSLQLRVFCTPIETAPTKWPSAKQAKICGNTEGGASIDLALQMRQTLEAIGDKTTPPGRIDAAADMLKDNGFLTFYLYNNHNDFYDSGSVVYPPIPSGGPDILAVQLVEHNKWATPPYLAQRPKILGFSVGDQNYGYSLVFENSEDRHELNGNWIPNDSIKNATAHEAGHQYAFLAGNLDQSAAFQFAWDIDMARMAEVPVCRHTETDQNGSTANLPGLYNGASDYKGNFICGGDGQGFSASYGGDSVAVMKAAYPYYGQPNLPLTEVFPAIFAERAGFPNYIDNSGNLINGSDYIVTSQALLCTTLYVWTWAKEGRDPTPAEKAGVGYGVPNGTQNAFKACDGSVTYSDYNFGS